MSDIDLDQLTNITGLFRYSTIIYLLLGIAFLIVVVKSINNIANRLHKKYPSRRLLLSQVATSLSFFIYLFGGTFLFYAVLNPPKELMIAAAGSAAVAIGLSLKDLVGSVIAGFILLFERPFQVGDRVSFGDVYGEIASIGLRSVRLITLDDSMVTIPNNRFMVDVVSSGNDGAVDMMITADLHIALDSDLNRARELLYEIVVTSRYVYLKKPVAIVVTEVPIAHRLALQLKAKAYVLDVRFEKAFQTDIFVRATEAFKNNGIKRPPIE